MPIAKDAGTRGHALVSGAAGFIGSHLVDSLLRDGWQVTAIDNFDPFYPAVLKQRNITAHRDFTSYRLREIDIRDGEALGALEGEYDAIVHLAAKAGVRASIRDPIGCQQVNVTGTQNLLEFARARGIRQFVFASSSSVYGVNPRVPWVEEDHVLLPISPYASTKVSGELLGHVYSHLYGIRFIALRFFTVYGPRQRPDLAIHAFAQKLLAGEPITLFGDGTTSRDYTYVDDIVAGVRAALTYSCSTYEVINLGNDRTVPLRDLVAALECVLNVRASVLYAPEQPGDVPRTWASIEKAKRLIGYTPLTTLDHGLSQFAQWLELDTSRSCPAAT